MSKTKEERFWKIWIAKIHTEISLHFGLEKTVEDIKILIANIKERDETLLIPNLSALQEKSLEEVEKATNEQLEAVKMVLMEFTQEFGIFLLQEQEKEKKPKVLQCPMCEYTTDSAKGLQIHASRKHKTAYLTNRFNFTGDED